MTPTILGVRHTPQNVEETLSILHSMLLANPNTTIALEPSSQKASNAYFEAITSGLKKFPNAKVIFIGNKSAETISGKAKFNSLINDTKLQMDMPLLEGEIQGVTRGEYVATVLRNKYFLKSIRKTNPDIVIVGATHAKVLASALKTQVKYVGITKEGTNENLRRIWEQIKEITAQRRKLFKQRKNKLKIQKRKR